MATLLVTGATGYLGRHLVRAKPAGVRMVAASRSGAHGPGTEPLALDLTDGAAVATAVARLRPDALIHAAAANPGREPADFDPVNVGGARAVSGAVRALGGHCRLVAVSSDLVHDGRGAPYADDAPARPISAYGRSKADAEAAVLEAVPGAVVARTSLIYGLEAMDRGTEGFSAALAAGRPPTLFTDVWRQPVSADSLATALIDLALGRRDVAGLLNLAGRQPLSRADFARRMLEHWQVEDRHLAREGSAAGLPEVPLDLRLRLDRADALGYELPGVTEVLARARRGPGS